MGDTNNIIFLDLQYYNGLTSTSPEILTIGMVKPTIYDGETSIQVASEFYLEIEPVGKIDQWIQSNIIPTLYGEYVPRDTAKQIISSYVINPQTNEKPYVITDAVHFNWIALCNLFGITGVPFRYPPISLDTILWHYGIDATIDKCILASNLGIDVKEIQTNYVVDNAKVILSIYYKLQELRSL
jgi:hypothetical protein